MARFPRSALINPSHNLLVNPLPPLTLHVKKNMSRLAHRKYTSLRFFLREWIKVAKRRLAELRSITVEAVPGNGVFARTNTRFEKWPSHFTPRLRSSSAQHDTSYPSLFFNTTSGVAST